MKKLYNIVVYIISVLNLVLGMRHFLSGNPFNGIYFMTIALFFIGIMGIFYLSDLSVVFKKNTQLLNKWTFTNCTMTGTDGKVHIKWEENAEDAARGTETGL